MSIGILLNSSALDNTVQCISWRSIKATLVGHEGLDHPRPKVLHPSTLSVKSADMNLKLALHAVSHMISDRNRHSGYQHLSEVGKQTLLVQYVPKWIRRWRIWVGSRRKQISLGHLGKTSYYSTAPKLHISCLFVSFHMLRFFLLLWIMCLTWNVLPQDEVKLNMLYTTL